MEEEEAAERARELASERVAAAPAEKPRRPVCGSCSRPPRACLCAHLPPAPVPLARTRVLILQHPAEAGRRKATAVLVERAVAPVTTCVGRTFDDLGRWPALAGALADAAAGVAPLLVLWPASPDALAVEEAAARAARGAGGPLACVTLLAIDGTWRQAREMWAAASASWLKDRPGVWVVRTAGGGGGADRSAGALFVEPAGGVCVSTAEAVAAGLAGLEPPGAAGPAAVAAAVAGFVRVTAAFDPAIAARLAGKVKASAPLRVVK